MLSDSKELIDRFLSYHLTEHPDSFSTYFGKGIQAILNSDNAELERNIQGLKKWVEEGWPKNYCGIVTAFEGFLESSKTKIEDGVNEVLSFHEQQDQPKIVKDYINLEATALAKLAWKKRIFVENESPLVPKELLDDVELKYYESYDFFKD